MKNVHNRLPHQRPAWVSCHSTVTVKRSVRNPKQIIPDTGLLLNNPFTIEVDVSLPPLCACVNIRVLCIFTVCESLSVLLAN